MSAGNNENENKMKTIQIREKTKREYSYGTIKEKKIETTESLTAYRHRLQNHLQVSPTAYRLCRHRLFRSRCVGRAACMYKTGQSTDDRHSLPVVGNTNFVVVNCQVPVPLAVLYR